MKFQCPACDHTLSIDKSLPRFCSNCGAPLEETVKSLDLSQQAPPPQGVEASPSLTDQPAAADVTAAFTKPVPTARTPAASQTTADQVPDQLPAGAEIGPYQIQNTLGAGGMGTVYRAVHQQSGQEVALKLLSRSVRTTDETVQRFQRESQIAASLNHPRSTFVYGASQHDGQFYITMELMTGGTLDDLIKQHGPLDVGRAVDYVLDMIDGLQAAHDAGIVHRDLKPSNCFIDQSGRVKIGDFGLAKSFLSDSSLTQTGAFMGTPQYAAPEQLRTSDVDERADIYAIGGTLFYLLVARPPFVGNAAQVISSIASETPPRISSLDKSIPNRLCRLIHQTLEKDPQRRPENLAELRQQLLPFSTRGATTADPGRRMAAFFVDGIILGMLSFLLSNLFGMLGQLMMFTEQLFLITTMTTVLATIGYFAIAEAISGTTPGKWLLRMRVTTMQNRPPGWGRSLIRATIMPGLMHLAHSLPMFLSGVTTVEDRDVDAVLWMVVGVFLLQLFSWVVGALCFVTARKSNGYRGIHEFASGTRTVRLSGELESQRWQQVPVTVPVTNTSFLNDSAADATIDHITPKSFGDFKVIGTLGRCGNSGCQVMLGRDEALDRDVWIMDGASRPIDTSSQRKSISRPTRVRILEEHREGDAGSVVVEAVKGLPVVEYIRMRPGLDWRSFRLLLHELVGELRQAESDQSLPEQLSLAQVWADERGHAKLLEQPVLRLATVRVANDQSRKKPIQEVNADQDFAALNPIELIKGLLDVFIDFQVVPAHVLTFREELEWLGEQQQPLEKIEQRLAELAELPAAWRWDDRAGILAVTMGLEMSILMTLLGSMAMLLPLLLPSVIVCSLLTFGLGSALVLLLGGLTRGGPVFRFSGVLVRRDQSLAPASALRCAVRNWVAWLPILIGLTSFAVMMAEVIRMAHLGVEEQMNLSVLVSLLLWLPLAAITVFGGIYSIARPSRGLQDWICGTRLIRK